MLEYLQQYNQLPQSLRDALAAPGILAAIHNLEVKYKVNLALVVMKAAIGEFNSANLSAGLMVDCKLGSTEAKKLSDEMAGMVFFVLPDFQKPAPVSNKPSLSPLTPATPKPMSNTNQQANTSSVDQRVSDLINKAKIDLASQLLLDRLKQILRTYLLGVRDRLAAKDALTKPVELGGLAFSSELADNLLRIADGKTSVEPRQTATRPSLPIDLDGSKANDYDLLNSLKSSGKLKASVNPLDNKSRLAALNNAKQEAGSRPAQPLPTNLPWHGSLDEAVAKPKQSASPAMAKASPIIKLPAKANPEPSSQSVVSSPNPVKSAQPTSQAVATPKTQVTAQPRPVPATVKPARKPSADLTVIPKPSEVQTKSVTPQYNKTESGAVKMDDIQFTPRVFTPIDELRYMTLKNFRNLSANPVEATELVKKKIQSLAKDDFSWKLEGISAWKQSPVNKIYVDIYHSAMNEGKQINQIIAERVKADPEAMSTAEFEAIFSFNQEVNLYK